MVSATIGPRRGILVIESIDHGQIVTQVLKWLQGGRELVLATGAGDLPLRHVDAVGNVQISEPSRTLNRLGTGNKMRSQ